MKVFTTSFAGDTQHLPFTIECIGELRRHYKMRQGSFGGGFATVGPGAIGKLLRYRPTLIIVSEFGILTGYSIIARMLLRRSRILLLVEARPKLMNTPRLNRLRVVVRRILVRHVDIILTNNNDGRGYLISELGAPPDRILASPYLVSSPTPNSDEGNRIHPSAIVTRDSDETCVFLYTGRLNVDKGIHFAIEACGKLHAEGVRNFEFWIVGGGPFRSELEQIALDLGLGKHVKFLGERPHAEIGHLLSNADVYLFPTLCDYRSLAVFEALSCGLPILCSVENGGVNEAVIEGENGYAFSPRDTGVLAGHMRTLIASPELRRRFAARSSELAHRYTVEEAAHTLYEASIRAISRQR
jgi:glycosyltransferase involved in cell wall biosynthesis